MSNRRLTVTISILISAAVTGSFFLAALGDCAPTVAVWILPVGAVVSATTIATLLYPKSMSLRVAAVLINLAAIPFLAMPMWVTEAAWQMLGVVALLELWHLAVVVWGLLGRADRRWETTQAVPDEQEQAAEPTSLPHKPHHKGRLRVTMVALAVLAVVGTGIASSTRRSASVRNLQQQLDTPSYRADICLSAINDYIVDWRNLDRVSKLCVSFESCQLTDEEQQLLLAGLRERYKLPVEQVTAEVLAIDRFKETHTALYLEPLAIDISAENTAAMPRVLFLSAYLTYPRENQTLAAACARIEVVFTTFQDIDGVVCPKSVGWSESFTNRFFPSDEVLKASPALAARYVRPTAEQQEMIEQVLWEANPYRKK